MCNDDGDTFAKTRPMEAATYGPKGHRPSRVMAEIWDGGSVSRANAGVRPLAQPRLWPDLAIPICAAALLALVIVAWTT